MKRSKSFLPVHLGRLLATFASLLALFFGGTASAQTNVKAGFGTVVRSNILHPVTNNTYDQVLMTGPTVTVAADPSQIVRVSLLDDNEDIMQVEFAGAGTVTVELDMATYVPPAPPLKYNQPGISYVKGHATVRVSNSGPDTFVSVFSVGRGNAVDQTLFRNGTTYDAMADVQLVQINGTEIGGVLMGNVRFSASTGVTGIQAPDTAVRYRVVIGEIDARETATPLLRLGQSSQLAWDAGAVLVAGGRLQQSNGAPIDASSSTGVAWPKINAVAGTLSSGDTVPAATISSQFASKSPSAVSVNGVARSTRGFVPASFDTLLSESGFDSFDFGAGATVQFSGGNNGTYAITINTVIEGEAISGRLDGTYSYSVSGTNQNRMTFSMTLDTISISIGPDSFNGTIYSLAQEAGEPLPTRITAVAEYATVTSGTFTMTLLWTDGLQQNHAGSFDELNGLDFGFL